MPEWRIKLISRENIADNSMAFRFERPRDLQFRAGQFVDLTLINPREIDSAGQTRTLTIASAPFEDQLMFAMRMRDTAFKRALHELEPGGEVLIDDPVGVFTLTQDSDKAAVLIAGGIGITPFLSMLRQAARDGLPRPLFLFYSNRRPEDAAFLSELQSISESNPLYRFIPTMTQMWRSKRPWKGEAVCIDADMLRRYIPAVRGSVYYIAGPPSMIESMRQKLLDLGVDRNDINADPFDGY